MSEAAINHAYDATNIFLQNKEERLKYVNREMALMDYRSGLMSAEERGEKRGEERGVRRFAQLVSKLHVAGRDREIVQAAQNVDLREKLFQEFHL